LIKRLAQPQHSHTLALLAQRVARAYRASQAVVADSFAKDKALISDMIERLV